MSEQTNRYHLPYLLPSQAQKHVTHNEAIRRIDGLTNLSLKNRDQNVPPSDPQEGDAFTIGLQPSDEWENHPGAIAVFADGAWIYTDPFQGIRAYDEAVSELLIFDNGNWQPVTASMEQLEQLGINTAADSNNRLAVKSDAILFTTDDQSASPSGDLRLNLNKTASNDVNSLMFQTGYSGRAEIGCPGSDNFQIKVSADGNSFTSALEIDNANGNIGIGRSPINVLDIEKPNDGTLTRGQIRNPFTTAGSGASINVSSGGHLTQFLQYSVGAAYFVSSSNSFYIQTTGANPSIRFFAGSVNPAVFTTQNVSFKIPAQLPNYQSSQLPSAATSGSGSLVFVSDETGGAVTAFSDGTNWHRTTDRQIVS